MLDSEAASLLDTQQLRDLLAAFDASDSVELKLSAGDFKVHLKKAQAAAVFAPVVHAPVPTLAVPTAAPTAAPAAELAASAPASPATAAPVSATTGVRSPMVGTFYQSPSPDAPPFVRVGDVVKPGQTVCIIEAMKLMNEIEAEQAGRVVRILVQNGQAVEFGQLLLELEPA
ncbi:MAG: acetyl-CoA carboxylase biotin carboxyl carrier protein [Candidatus Sericytochromatia bacterium]|nr:acetyl-CoA carboxylase biotin carboxyl carrier protein [Candidatus Sericytochromatia bacterium]